MSFMTYQVTVVSGFDCIELNQIYSSYASQCINQMERRWQFAPQERMNAIIVGVVNKVSNFTACN